MVVQRTSINADGVLMSNPHCCGDVAAARIGTFRPCRSAVQEMLAPGLTAARLGLQWREVKEAGGYYELDGLSPVQIAVRGKFSIVANGAGLTRIPCCRRKTSSRQPSSYAAGFSHTRERENFYKFTGLVDQPSVPVGTEPQFFSRNIASFSRTFAKLDSEEIVTRQTKIKSSRR